MTIKSQIASFAFVIVGLTCTAWAIDYKNLVVQGYRWVMVDGPYACTSEEELERSYCHRNDVTELHMVENLQAYYLIPGSIVRILKNDPATGTSEIELPGITTSLWTYSRFLSTDPIEDTYGVIETPENAGFIPSGDLGVIQVPREQAMPMPTRSIPWSFGESSSTTAREVANQLRE